MMKKKAVTSESQVPTLPDHLIMEQILPRLPVKSLLRFKAVSKYWLSTICSHEFEAQQLKFSSLCPQAILLTMGSFVHPSYVLSFDECNNVKEFVELKTKYPVLNLPSPNPSPNPNYRIGDPSLCYVVGSCNGLVCLFDQCFCFYLWNPATNQCQNVRFPDNVYHHLAIAEVFPCMGFGYVSSIDDYRIGFLLCGNGNDDSICQVPVYIFSLKARKWTTMAIVDYDFRLSERESVVVDDTLYWSPEPRNYLGRQSHIVGLNLVSGKLKKFPLMNLVIGYLSVHVSRMKGCLSLCCFKFEDVEAFPCSCFYDVWMLKQPDDWNSWEKAFALSVGVTDLHHLFETGKCLVSQEQLLKLLDPFEVAPEQYEEGSKKEVNFPIYVDEARRYAESLVSPFGTFIANENEKEEDSRERVEEERS